MTINNRLIKHYQPVLLFKGYYLVCRGAWWPATGGGEVRDVIRSKAGAEVGSAP